MSVEEMKLEAISKITKVENQAVLAEVLKLLDNSMGKVVVDESLAKNYDAIKAQYGDVLQKLAQ